MPEVFLPFRPFRLTALAAAISLCLPLLSASAQDAPTPTPTQPPASAPKADAGKAADGKSHHAPAYLGECTSCHEPHGSGKAKLLVAEGQALCDTCHAEQTKSWAGQPVVHAALSDCNTCHGAVNKKRPPGLSAAATR